MHMLYYTRTHMYEGCMTFRQTPRARKKRNHATFMVSQARMFRVESKTLLYRMTSQSRATFQFTVR